jgi:hypothetical protein
VWVPAEGGAPAALSFDGVMSYVEVSGTVPYATQSAPFSFSAWANLETFTDDAPDITQFRTDTPHAWHVLFSNNPSYLGVSVGSCDTWVPLKSDVVPTTGVFHHVAVTYNGQGPSSMQNFQIYLDGVSQTMSQAAGYGCQTPETRSEHRGRGTVRGPHSRRPHLRPRALLRRHRRALVRR